MAGLVPMDPIPFPVVVLNPARTLRGSVQEDDGSANLQLIISSSSGVLYQKGRRLKQAIYGEVCEGFVVEALSTGGFRRTGVRVALKIIIREKFDLLRSQNCPEDPMAEIACLKFIRDTATASHPTPPNRYPNLCYFYEAMETPGFIISVMEFIDGMESYDYMDENGALLSGEARGAFSQIVAGWAVLHELGISHRDMSLENVMFCTTPEVRAVIIDFGMARRAHTTPDGTHHPFPVLGQAGKPQYMAPEVILNRDAFRGCEVDVWALGVILFQLIAGHPPLTTAVAVDDLFTRICHGQLPALIRHWGHPFSPEAVDMVNRMLQQHGRDRISLADIRSHPWWTAAMP